MEAGAHMTARILIADDHEMVRRGIRSLLESSRRDIEVLEARNGREAVNSTIDWKPDLVILDLSMPQLDGFGATREIKKVSPDTSILILTFQKTDTLAEVARRIGVNGFLTKGEDSGVLLKAIDSAIGIPKKTHSALKLQIRDSSIPHHKRQVRGRPRKFPNRPEKFPQSRFCAFFSFTAA